MSYNKPSTGSFNSPVGQKQKLVKNDIKIRNTGVNKDKKPNQLRPISSNVSTNIKKSSNSNINPSIKKRNSISSSNKKHSNKKTQKQIPMSQDLAARILQKNLRIYLVKIKSDPQYEYKQMLKRKKMNILKNYNLVDNVRNNISGNNDKNNENDFYFDYPVAVSIQKPQDEIKNDNDNLNLQNSIKEKPLAFKQSIDKDNMNEISNIKDTSNNNINNGKQNNSSYLDIMNQMNQELNEDLKGLSNKFMCEDVDEEIKDDYNKEDKKKRKENEKIKIDINPKGSIDHKLKDMIEEMNDDNQKINPNISNNSKLKDMIDEMNENSKIKQENEEENENIYERIFREMQKGKSSKNEKIINEVIDENNIDEVNQKTIGKKDNFEIKPIMIKKEKSEQINPVMVKKIEQNIINRTQIDENHKDTFGLTSIEVNQNKSELVKNTSLSHYGEDKPKIYNENEEKIKITDTITKLLQNTSQVDQEEQSINESKNKSNNSSSKKEVYNRLANFLDSSTANPVPVVNPPKTVPNILDEAQNQADIIGLNLELKEAQKTIATMTSVITELKNQLKAKDDYLNKALLSQKNETDVLLERQNTLMESLYSEKKKMESQITDLQEKLNQHEKISYKKLQTMRENYEIETKKNKDAWFQAEKLRRKKWEELKIKEIKEITAKGLEPEIEKIIANHKTEIANLEDEFRTELKTQKERLMNECDEKITDIKKKLIREKEDAIEHEKNLTVQRLRNQSERLEDEINEERRRWNAKLQNEISRLESLREKDKKIYEEQISKLEERNNNNIFSNENFYAKKLEDIKKDYESKLQREISNMKLSYEKENESILSKKQAEMEAKFKEMKLDLLKDRDKQINIVIEKLGEETLQERKKNALEAEKKANEKNTHLIEENRSLTKKINDLTEKLQAETKNRINLEENIDILAKKLNNKEIELDKKEKRINEITIQYNEMTDKLSSLTRDFNKEKMNLEIEMKSHLQKGDAEIALLNNKLQTAHKLLDQQREDIESIHRKEIEEIEKKIKKSFKRKDEIIQKLQEDLELKEVTIQKYEEMLNQQRKELFGK